MLSQLFSFCTETTSVFVEQADTSGGTALHNSIVTMVDKERRAMKVCYSVRFSVWTHPEHLYVDDLINVLLLVVLVPDEDLCRLVCLRALEALR